MNQMPVDNNFCVIVPAYQEERRIGEVVRSISRLAPAVVVIDDGSPDATAAAATAAGAIVLRHARNLGKGAALHTGFNYAREHGYAFLLTMDADGQHAPADIPRFLETYQRTALPVLIGNRMDNPINMPRVRRWTNRFMSWYLSRIMRQTVPDTQSGFRLYRCDILPSEQPTARGYAAESEILLWLAERGVRMGAVPITVIYQDEISKINPWRDTLRFWNMIRRQRRRRS
ncbi:MAG: glycosyltransferase family 2 protein [Lentisphaerae bacterium]|nr:glycosyltransferase family 2 protein [Lentisphaerota bacterium]